MKGLLLKEWYSFYGSPTLLLFLLVFFKSFSIAVTFHGWSIWNINRNIIEISLIAIYIVFVCTLSFFKENQEKWDTFRNCLPFNPKDIVDSKYIVSSIILIITVLITAIFLIFPIYKKQATFTECSAMLILITSISLLSLSLILPGLFRFNGKKRILYYISVFILLFALLFIILHYLKPEEIQFTESITENFGAVSIRDKLMHCLNITYFQQAIIMGASIVLYLLSWLLSIKLYKKGKFLNH